jgi:hypothetical protein
MSLCLSGGDNLELCSNLTGFNLADIPMETCAR